MVLRLPHGWRANHGFLQIDLVYRPSWRLHQVLSALIVEPPLQVQIFCPSIRGGHPGSGRKVSESLAFPNTLRSASSSFVETPWEPGRIHIPADRRSKTHCRSSVKIDGLGSTRRAADKCQPFAPDPERSASWTFLRYFFPKTETSGNRSVGNIPTSVRRSLRIPLSIRKPILTASLLARARVRATSSLRNSSSAVAARQAPGNRSLAVAARKDPRYRVALRSRLR